MLASLLVGSAASPNPCPHPTTTQSQDPLRLAIVGDIMLARHVERRANRTGYDSLFAHARAELEEADLALGNLECALSERPTIKGKKIVLRAKPKAAEALAKAGFDALSLANNHAFDCGPAGLTDTVQGLQEAGILPVGTSPKPQTIERNGVRIALLAYCDFPNDSGGPGISYTPNLPLPLERSERGRGPGGRVSEPTNHPNLPLPLEHSERTWEPGTKDSVAEQELTAQILSAKKDADVLVVLWHWGTEGSSEPDARQKRLARIAANAGADLIVGSHPHVLQPIGWLTAKSGNRCLVAYSIGNFVFDSTKETERRSAILNVQIGKIGVRSWSLSGYRIRNGAPVKSR